MITSRVLDRASGVRHAFFSRRGGVSEGIYASLNCGPGSDDDRLKVERNRARAMEMLGLSGDRLVTAYQVHSGRVAVVEGPWTDGAPSRFDGLVTARKGVALGVLTADCAPVLFAGAGAVGAAHAGWRGARAGILEATVEAMQRLGAGSGDVLAAIGPCIGQDSYGVGLEFMADFLADDPGNEKFFAAAGRDGQRLFDLAGYVSHRLSGLGLKAVEVLAYDSCRDEERFFSYRRARRRGEKDYGRCLSAIVLGD